MKRKTTQKSFTKLVTAIFLAFSSVGIAQPITDCLDFTEINNSPSTYNDDLLHPAGSTVLTSGFLDVIKPYPSNATMAKTEFLPGLESTELLFDNWVYLSTARLACDDISLSVTSLNAFLVVNNDTITSYPYTGDTYSVQTSFLNMSELLITGDFDTVKLGGVSGKIAHVCLTYGASCVSTSQQGVEQGFVASHLYPNPSSGKVFVDVKTSNSELSVYNNLGVLVSTETVLQAGIKEINIQTPGIYFVSISNNNVIENNRVIIK